jgi:hypothetical protein
MTLFAVVLLALVVRVQCKIVFDWNSLTAMDARRFTKMSWSDMAGPPFRLCSNTGSQNSELVPSYSVRLTEGSFRVEFSRARVNDTEWSSITVSIAKLAGIVINDFFYHDNPLRRTCENSVCILLNSTFAFRGEIDKVALLPDRITLAATWNVTGNVSNATLHMMKFYINGVALDLGSAGDPSLAPPDFLNNSAVYTVHCRHECSTCLESITIWDSIEDELLSVPKTKSMPTTSPPTTTSPTTRSTSITTPPPTSTSISSTTTPTTASNSNTTTINATSSSIPTTINVSLPIDSTSSAGTSAVVGGAVGGSFALLFIVIGAGWLVFAFRRKQKTAGAGQMQMQPAAASPTPSPATEYGPLGRPPADYNDVHDVRE